MVLLRETGAVLLIGALLGLAVGIVRGFPEPPPPPPDATSCVSPVPDRPAIRWVTQEEAAGLVSQEGVVFVDARAQDVFVAGHVLNALHVPVDTGTIPPSTIALLRGYRTVIAYDDTESGCARSTRVAGLLATEGLPDVRVLQGGMPEWNERGYPAEAGTCRLCP